MRTYKPRFTNARSARPKKGDAYTAYSVYIFHRPAPGNDNSFYPINWERRHKTFTLRAAVRKAEKLFKTSAYDRVEIREISYDGKSRQKKDRALKIYEERSGRPVGLLGFFRRFF